MGRLCSIAVLVLLFDVVCAMLISASHQMVLGCLMLQAAILRATSLFVASGPIRLKLGTQR